MIDTKELRRKLRSDDLIDHVDIHANVKSVLAELLDRLEAAEKDAALKERIIDSLGSELNAVANERDALRATLMAVLDVLEEVKGNINPERGYADELEADVERAITAIALPGAKGE